MCQSLFLPFRLLTATTTQDFITPAVAVTLFGAFLTLYDRLVAERMKSFATKDDLKEALKDFATKEDLKDDMKEILLAIAGVPRAVRSLALGLKQVEKEELLTALATASPADVEELLEKWGFSQYSHRLAPLGGAGLLMLTESTLAAMDVAPEHRALLLEKVYGCDG